MSRDEVLSRLSAHRSEWERFRVASLSLFGSHARDEARPDSDVDILVEFEGRLTFHRYMEFKFYLEDLLGRRVDLVTQGSLRDRVRPYVEREAIHVA